MSRQLKLGIKFCGGCNVKFDRIALLENIRDHFGDQIEIGYTSQSDSFDLIVVLNACWTACASLDGLNPRLGMYVVRTDADAQINGPVIAWIKSFLDDGEP